MRCFFYNLTKKKFQGLRFISNIQRNNLFQTKSTCGYMLQTMLNNIASQLNDSKNHLICFYALYLCQSSKIIEKSRSTTKSSTLNQNWQNLHKSYLILYVLQYTVPYCKDSQQSTHQGFHPTFNWASITHIHRSIIYRESYTLIPWYLIVCYHIVTLYQLHHDEHN